ncbi:hypothetical protein [Acidithiobacillus sulfuriphilus]
MGRKHIAILLEISLALSDWKAAGAARWPLRYPAAGCARRGTDSP